MKNNLFILTAAAFTALCGLALADTIITKDGETITGKIIEEKDRTVKIRVYDGREISLKEYEIKEKKAGKSLFDEYDEYVKDKELKTAEEQYKLAVWCKEKQLWVKAVEHYEKALELDPKMETAKEELSKLKDERKKAAAPKKKTYPKKSPGMIEKAYVTLDNAKEMYSACIPSNYSNTKPNPAVILCHGNGMHAMQFLTMVKGPSGVTNMLMLSLERCDSKQFGYVAKYVLELEKEFYFDPQRTYILGYSGGGFRTWADIFMDEYMQKKFTAICFVGSGKGGGDVNAKIPKYDEDSPAVIMVGDTASDPNFKGPCPEAVQEMKDQGYPEPAIIKTHNGHVFPTDKMKDVFAWFQKQKKKKK